jgi:hypothetical protein
MSSEFGEKGLYTHRPAREQIAAAIDEYHDDAAGLRARLLGILEETRNLKTCCHEEKGDKWQLVGLILELSSLLPSHRHISP